MDGAVHEGSFRPAMISRPERENRVFRAGDELEFDQCEGDRREQAAELTLADAVGEGHLACSG